MLARCEPAALAEALRKHPAATLVVALDCDGRAAQAAVSAADRAQSPFLVVVGGAPADGALPDAWIEAPTGANAAVDLALLACGGVASASSRYEIGARSWTAANRAAGGALTVAPADPILALLRGQRGDLLTTERQSDQRLRFAFWSGDVDTAREEAALSEVRLAAARYPQVELVERRQLAGTVEAGARAILLATQDPERTRRAAAEAQLAASGPLPVFALDPLLHEAPGASSLGCAPMTLARAAAAEIRALLPEGGRLLLCCPAGEDAATAARRRALAEALGLEPDLLR